MTKTVNGVQVNARKRYSVTTKSTLRPVSVSTTKYGPFSARPVGRNERRWYFDSELSRDLFKEDYATYVIVDETREQLAERHYLKG